MPIVVKKTLPVEIKTGSAYTAGTLPVGTQLTITASDDIEYAYYVTSQGAEGRIAFTGEGIRMIDGIDEFEYFEELFYAG